MNRAFTNILSSNVTETASFYQELLQMNRHFDSDWFVILTHADCHNFEFGILDRNNPLVPEKARHQPAGVLLTFVVDDVEATFLKAKDMNVAIIEEPTDTPYGQRRMLVEDPDGTLVDVSSLTPR